jgi:hypothetical protein
MSTAAERDLQEWARVTGDRDNRIRAALAEGITKHRIHTITGISRATIDRILAREAVTGRSRRRVPGSGGATGGGARAAG